MSYVTGVGLLCFDLGGSRSKLGGAYRVRLQLMPQLQTQVPHPLAHDTPCLLTASRVTAPSIRVDLLIFVGECRLKFAADPGFPSRSLWLSPSSPRPSLDKAQFEAVRGTRRVEPRLIYLLPTPSNNSAGATRP